MSSVWKVGLMFLYTDTASVYVYICNPCRITVLGSDYSTRAVARFAML